MENKITNDEHTEKVESIKNILSVLLKPLCSHEWDRTEFHNRMNENKGRFQSHLDALHLVENVISFKQNENDETKATISISDEFIPELAELIARLYQKEDL